MRLKEFIIFIIIFTIVYCLFFYVYDILVSKKANKTRKQDIDNIISINRYAKFCAFYNIKPMIDQILLKNLYFSFDKVINVDLKALAETYGLDINELVVVVLFFEYLGVIKMRKILAETGWCVPLDDSDEALSLKYSLFLSNKYDYDTIVKRTGINSDKELLYMNNNFLIPGAILNNGTLSYVGDLDE